MQNERGQLDKLKNLEDLGQLKQVVQSINSMKASFDNQNSSLSKQIGVLSQAISGMKSNNQITASIGMPPIALWIVSALVGLAALLIIIGNFSSWFAENPTSSESIKDNYAAVDTMTVDSVKIVDTVAAWP